MILLPSPRFRAICLLALLPTVAAEAWANTAGIAAHQSTPKDPNGMKAETFFKLLDASLGNKFSGLILTFGGCFTASFTKAAKTSAVGTSGKPVAVLAATSETNDTQFSGGSNTGNHFTRGIVDGLGGDPPGTTADGFAAGKARASRAAKAAGGQQDPTFTPLAGGDQLKLGVAATSYHAILFVGRPENVSDWMDLQQQYKELIARGYPEQNIKCFFGRGERAADGWPVLSKSDGSAGKSVGQAEGAATDNGQHIEAATEKNLEDALKALKAIADASATEQYFIWAADHSVWNATAFVPSTNCGGTGLCSVGASVDQAWLGMPMDNPPCVELTPVGIVRADHSVFLNGTLIGTLDPALDGRPQAFPVALSQVLNGTNTIGVATQSSTFRLDDVSIATGTVPLANYALVPVPGIGPWQQVMIFGVIMASGAWLLRRRYQ